MTLRGETYFTKNFMKPNLIIKDKNLMLLNFDYLFTKIEIDILNEIQKYNLFVNNQINFSNKDIKKILFHNIIYGMCESIINNDSNYKKAIIIPPNIRTIHEISKFCNTYELEVFITKLSCQIKNKIPFIIYISNSFIFETADDANSGELLDLTNIIFEYIDRISNKTFTFEKIKKFSSQYDLSFLSKTYFDTVKTRLILG